MEELEEAGWQKAEEKKEAELTEGDLRQIFNLVDIDKSGAVTKRVNLVHLAHSLPAHAIRV
jgi:hypothetical protein